MTDQEKLVELINKSVEIYTDGYQRKIAAAETIADYLLAHGVTVKQMEKPILETELMVYLHSPVWFEEFGRDVEEIPLLLDGLGIYYAEFKEYGRTERLDRRLDDYNYLWRCWANRPTVEERKAAEWL